MIIIATRIYFIFLQQGRMFKHFPTSSSLDTNMNKVEGKKNLAKNSLSVKMSHCDNFHRVIQHKPIASSIFTQPLVTKLLQVFF